MRIKPLYIVFLAVLIFYVLYHSASYGFRLSNCPYSEVILSYPDVLKNKTIILENLQSDQYSPNTSFLSDASCIKKSKGEHKLYPNNNIILANKGDRFLLNNVIAIEKHGLLIDESKYFIYLVLENQKGFIIVPQTDLKIDPTRAPFHYLENGESVPLTYSFIKKLFPKY